MPNSEYKAWEAIAQANSVKALILKLWSKKKHIVIWLIYSFD